MQLGRWTVQSPGEKVTHEFAADGMLPDEG